MAWYKKTECIASLTVLLPLNEKDKLLIPPLTFDFGKFSLVGDEIFAKQLKNLESGYESKINTLLKYEIKRNE